jgi:CRP-like cAMP-binding protein
LITYVIPDEEQNVDEMDETLSKLIALRETPLFERLPSDVLFVVATEAEWQKMSAGEVIFSAGDLPDGLYVVTSGQVSLSTKGKPLSWHSEFDVFGEFEIINNSPRLSTATAAVDGTMLHIDQITFDDIINEFPDVLRAITSKVIRCLQEKQAEDDF